MVVILQPSNIYLKMEVQIVIKAPNQNVGEDHVVNCNLEWTVKQLKEHLKKAYPNKPKVKEQKLIYSGHLLLNHLRLKDILRHDDSNSSVHILHLVCNSDSSFVQPSQTWALPVTRPLPMASGQSTSSTVRQRNLTSVPPTNTIFPQNVAPQATIPVFMPDTQMVAQYAAMQQMYAYYFSQYIQSTYNPGAVPAYNPPLQGVANYQAPVNEAPVPNVQELQLQPEANDFLNRDWLDHAFQCCRLFMLIMLLYCYSTPERLGIVLFCAGIAVMYQEGWFQFLRRPPFAVPAEVVPPQDALNVEDLPDFENYDEEPLLVNPDFDANDDNFGEYEIEATMDGDDPPHAHPQSDDANNNHIFSPLTFLSTFFSSLIPDPPPPPININ
ncbi:hypothetical protein JTE90_002984 [Oedothorax gibbosus]|uniref:Ubiquitin-like domain-containing protein n=1 Tax=Oedothorax gibbosus TaxID=931172 RepID=A0AAV6VJ92_9ARAC|nr:hypothetical protein JTE90_002984 [Oedothorax gibbosus]